MPATAPSGTHLAPHSHAPAGPQPASPTGKGTRSRWSSKVREYWPPLFLTALLILCWQVGVRVFDVEHYILPAPTDIVTAFREQWSITLASATWVTLVEVVLGFVLALVAALLIATLLHSSKILRRGLYPILIGSQTVPIVVIGPVLAIIFGYSMTPKLILVTIVCFFPIVVSALDGLSSPDPQLLRMMRTLYGSRWSTFRRVEFPAALPSIFSGLRIAATYASIGAVFGEYAGSENGLGYVMIQAIPQLQTALVFAAIVLLTLMSSALFFLVTCAEKIIAPWAHEGNNK